MRKKLCPGGLPSYTENLLGMRICRLISGDDRSVLEEKEDLEWLAAGRG
jgi:hypothetical protein